MRVGAAARRAQPAKYSRRRTASTSWRETSAADLVAVAP
jgi:hypothetical protein